MNTAARAPATTLAPPGPWYGPESQFWPHWILWGIIKAFFASILNTVIGLCYCLIHPRKTIRGLWYCVEHPRETIGTVAIRMRASLRRNGIFYTGTCLLCMVVLPGAGLFGKVAELSEAGRKAQRLNGVALPADGGATYSSAQPTPAGVPPNTGTKS